MLMPSAGSSLRGSVDAMRSSSLSRRSSLTGWEIDEHELCISKQEDGSKWMLGQGSYGKASLISCRKLSH